ncbi:MAG: T9SS type A sorting domain-containing protein [Flavobacterium sp.]|nr:MAG: T9SS type A sorting domain-containing protein [Flavobacterium sp.]
MKKITLSLVFLLSMIMGGYGQVTVGEGTSSDYLVPYNPYYAYSYGQSIYLASEINATGTISTIQWYYTGTGAMANSQQLKIYIGHTDKTEFESELDFVEVADMTEVFAGGITTSNTSGWKTITLTTPFVYDGTSNLVIAVDESQSGYDASTDKFRYSGVGVNRSIYVYTDYFNVDPLDPTNNYDYDSFEYSRGMVQYVPNIIFGGITQSCATPTGVTTSGVINTEATINWPADGNTTWEVYVAEQSAPAPTASTVGVTVTGTPTYLKTGLTQNTAYSAYVRLKCSETLYSAWSSPRNFITACDAFGVPFLENFNSDSTTINCWKVINGNNDADVWSLYTTAPIEGNQSAMLYTDGNAGNNNDWLIMPRITLTGTQQLSFKYKVQSANEPNDLRVVLSTTGSEEADFTNILMPLTSFNNTTAAKKVLTLSGYTGDVFIAFHVPNGGLDGWRLYIDEVEIDEAPSTPPVCVEDVNVVPNEGCGNFATVFTWPAVDGADGYKAYVGTSPNGQNLVVDGVDVGTSLTYSFSGNPGTTYYYTIKSYNAFGLAIDCFEDTFSTYDDGCYCVALPTSNDGLGISSVQINNEVTPVGDVYYANFTENGAIDITQGVNTSMNVTLATGLGYWTHVWIDFDDNYTFTENERVYTSLVESASANPTILNTSFMTPLNANLGEHRMRIVSTDAQQTPPNPCYNGSWGVVLDFAINVLEAPDCLPPSTGSASNIMSTTAQLNWTSTNALFNIEYGPAGFTPGMGTTLTGVTTNNTNIANLTAQTNYDFYVQTDCGNSSLSPWVGPFLFRTACAQFGSFTENFTTEVNYNVPECWHSKVTSTNTFAGVFVYNYNDYAYFYNSDDVNASVSMITPSLTDLPLSTHRAKFRAYGPAGSSIIVGTMSDPTNSATFTPVQTIPLTTSYADYSVAFLAPTTDTHVVIRSVFTATYQYIYLDDFVWEVAPACPDVNIVNFVSSTPYTADITWIPGGLETEWQYVYALSTVTDPSTLTPVDVATTPAATISGLAPASIYKVWVRAKCGENYGIFSAPKTFMTACVPLVDLPWVEGFEGLTTFSTTSFPPCWSKENGDWSSTNATTYNTPRNGSNYIRNAWSATNEYMWTPGFELTAGTSYDFSFYMQGDGWTGWNVDVFHNTNQNSTGATQLGTTVTASGSGSITIQPYASVKRTFVPTTSGVYYFAVRVNQTSGSPWYVAFDDFRFEQTPTCIAPNAPTATNATTNTATMNWVETTPAPANGYEYYATNTTTLPNASTVPTGNVGVGVTTANLSDLIPASTYKIYVRGICSDSDKSPWSEAGTFTTSCVPATLPYSIDFENVTTPALPLCTTVQNNGNGNPWATFSPNEAGFNTKVLRFVWNGTYAGNTWFYTNTVSLLAGTEYVLSYDYGNNDDELYTEKMKVAYGSTANAAAMTNILADHPQINQGTLQSNDVTFTPSVSGDYVIGFQAYSNADQYMLYLDNIVIEESLGRVNIDHKSFTAYPNPVKDILNINYTQNITDVAVYNILGQQVLNSVANANKTQLDMSSLATGTYLVKVKTENAVKTIKI